MLSPMMKQYVEIKEQYKDCILFFRLGDFYEMFFDDAITASSELDLTLTGRDCGLSERAPMCGVPFHAADTYIAKLIERGHKVAICEQLTPPGVSKIVKRDIVRVITPGTLMDNIMLAEDKNNYLVSASCIEDKIGIVWTDISTGEFNYTQFDEYDTVKFNEILSRICPSEIICNQEMLLKSVELSVVKYGTVCPFTIFNETAFDCDNALKSLSDNLNEDSVKEIARYKACVSAGGALLSYVEKTQKRSLNHFNKAIKEKENAFLTIDMNARKTLELVQTVSGQKRGSLLWLLNKTKTTMGCRLLRSNIEMPFCDADEINLRLDAVAEMVSSARLREDVGAPLKRISDLERLCGRISYGNISPKDCLSLGYSLQMLPLLKDALAQCKTQYIVDSRDNIKVFDEITELIVNAIDEDAPNLVRDGGMIKKGYDAELDEYREVKNNAKKLLAEMELAEKEETGIKNLKIGFNKVFGYYIEVSKTQLSLVPYRFIRKQTIASGERFITEELKELEEKILHSEELALKRELILYDALIQRLKEYIQDILETAKAVAKIDLSLSMAEVAKENNYVRPQIMVDDRRIDIVEGRHPVVEKIISDDFVPNDTHLDESGRIMLITGPNMAGKSIYMRQVALIVIMAHMGSFVPALEARIALTDKIFTRVGASDDLNTGRSTFMVEMSEVSSILSGATDRSLILLDEIGRGTSTYDGLSIAWAIMEYLSKNYKSHILFSTHYHELTELEGVLDGVKNYKLTVKEVMNSIVFLRKLLRGSANKSFGIEVAGLAGLPDGVLSRAKQILKKLTSVDIVQNSNLATSNQLSMFGSQKSNEIITVLKDLNMDDISPRAAYDILADLKEKAELQ
ncbi:MAG: DNA mismatch repair protein MutS [Clostridia bacterium]|nr:DNA mismatch repair protein MutS [Clostridia bacterium]